MFLIFDEIKSYVELGWWCKVDNLLNPNIYIDLHIVCNDRLIKRGRWSVISKRERRRMCFSLSYAQSFVT